MLSQWRMAAKYGYRWDLVSGEVRSRFERVWLCEIRRQHQAKFSTAPHCVRCGRVAR